MTAWENFAIINDGKIEKVIPYLVGTGGNTQAAVEALREYGPDALAVNVTQHRVGVGDTYENGRFFRNNNGELVEITADPTEEETVEMLKASVESIVISMLEG